MQKRYSFTGTYRKTNSIGVDESFTAHTTAETAEKAMDDIRADFYEKGFEHILFRTCRENEKQVTMLSALGLE